MSHKTKQYASVSKLLDGNCGNYETEDDDDDGDDNVDDDDVDDDEQEELEEHEVFIRPRVRGNDRRPRTRSRGRPVHDESRIIFPSD